MCTRSGNKVVFQSNHRYISPRSLENYMRTANKKLAPQNTGRQPKMLPDFMVTGFHKFQYILKEEFVAKRTSRYKWGCPKAGIPDFDSPLDGNDDKIEDHDTAEERGNEENGKYSDYYQQE